MIEWKQRVQKLRRFNVETTWKNPRGKSINISSILKVESTAKFPHRINVTVSAWIRLSKLMWFPRTFHVELQRRIDGESTRMRPLGSDYRSGRPEVFCKKVVLKNLEKFTGKHLCQSLFFNKVADLRKLF